MTPLTGPLWKQSSISPRALDLGVIAKGVESRETIEKLLAMSCVRGQGSFISLPMTAKNLGPILRTGVVGLGGDRSRGIFSRTCVRDRPAGALVRARAQVIVLRNVELRVTCRPAASGRPDWTVVHRGDRWPRAGRSRGLARRWVRGTRSRQRSPRSSWDCLTEYPRGPWTPRSHQIYPMATSCSHCSVSEPNSTLARGCWPEGRSSSSSGAGPAAFAGDAVRLLHWPPKSGLPRAPAVVSTPTPG